MAMQRSHIWVSVIAALFLLPCVSCEEEEKANSTRYRLHKFLFHDYNKHVRPSHTRNLAVNISIEFILNSVLHLYEREQKIITSSQIIMIWHDRLLEWNPDEYGNITRLTLEQKDVWLPDINVGNSMVKINQLGYDRSPIGLSYTGRVRWSTCEILETACPVDITYFPFDMQTCVITISALSSGINDLDLSPIHPETPIDTVVYVPSSKWELTETWAEFVRSSQFTVFVDYHLNLKRRPIAVVLNILLPLFFLATTATLVFALPIDSDERLSMAITVILAYAVYLTIVSDNLPESSVRVAALSITILILIFICTLIVLTTVGITAMYRWDGRVGPRVDAILRGMQWRRRWLCKSHSKDAPSDEPVAMLKNGDKETADESAESAVENAMFNWYGPKNKEESHVSNTTRTTDAGANNSRLTYTEGALILDAILFWFFKIATFLTILGLGLFLTTAPSKASFEPFENPFDKEK